LQFRNYMTGFCFKRGGDINIALSIADARRNGNGSMTNKGKIHRIDPKSPKGD